MSEKKELSKSAAVIAKTMYAAMRLLDDAGGSMPFTELRDRIAAAVTFTEWEAAAPSDKTRKPRWEINMTFYASDYTVAGFMAKDGGVWYLTDEGRKMLSQSAEQVFAAAHTAFRIAQRQSGQYEGIDDDIHEVVAESPKMEYEDAEARAMSGLRQYVTTMEWTKFQELCAALLRSFGYYVPFVAPQGPDGGIDVLAYENASGAGHRLIVQAKRFRDSSVGVEVVRNIAALLHKPTDIGMVITSGRFTTEAVRFAQSCKCNLRLVDLTELLRLWISHYDRLSLSDRSLMPLHAVFFLEQ